MRAIRQQIYEFINTRLCTAAFSTTNIVVLLIILRIRPRTAVVSFAVFLTGKLYSVLRKLGFTDNRCVIRAKGGTGLTMGQHALTIDHYVIYGRAQER